jgi:hypothetical protein
MANERNYGNTSHTENSIRSKYHLCDLNTVTLNKRVAKQERQDCITCNKNITGRIPSHHACKLICGTTTKKIVMNTHSRGKREPIYTIERQTTTKL